MAPLDNDFILYVYMYVCVYYAYCRVCRLGSNMSVLCIKSERPLYSIWVPINLLNFWKQEAYFKIVLDSAAQLARQ